MRAFCTQLMSDAEMTKQDHNRETQPEAIECKNTMTKCTVLNAEEACFMG